MRRLLGAAAPFALAASPPPPPRRARSHPCLGLPADALTVMNQPAGLRVGPVVRLGRRRARRQHLRLRGSRPLRPDRVHRGAGAGRRGGHGQPDREQPREAAAAHVDDDLPARRGRGQHRLRRGDAEGGCDLREGRPGHDRRRARRRLRPERQRGRRRCRSSAWTARSRRCRRRARDRQGLREDRVARRAGLLQRQVPPPCSANSRACWRPTTTSARSPRRSSRATEAEPAPGAGRRRGRRRPRCRRQPHEIGAGPPRRSPRRTGASSPAGPRSSDSTPPSDSASVNSCVRSAMPTASGWRKLTMPLKPGQRTSLTPSALAQAARRPPRRSRRARASAGAACAARGGRGSSRTGPGPRRWSSGRSARCSCSARRARSTAPPTTSECPPRYFVVECTTASAPSSSGRWLTGVANVLSTATSARAGARPRPRCRRRSAAGSSASRPRSAACRRGPRRPARRGRSGRPSCTPGPTAPAPCPRGGRCRRRGRRG